MEAKLHREYPHLLFKKNWELSEATWLLLGQCEAYINAINNTPILPHHYTELMNVALLKGAQATTAIEGNTLSDEEIQKMMAGQKLPPSKEYQEIEVQNILDALNELLTEVVDGKVDHIISVELIKRFHKMVGKNLGEHLAAIPGRLRNNDVIVGSYRCPDYRDVTILLDKFCNWIRAEFKFGQKVQSFGEVLVQAIVSHIYVEWIHPFGDGNGRTGRLLEFYLLLRGGNPDISSHILSNFYNLTRTEYYRQIEKARENRDLTCFIDYALLGFRDGLEQTLLIIQKSQLENTWQKLIYDKFDAIKSIKRDEVFKRQRTLALEFPVDRGLSLSEVSLLTVQLARIYAQVSEKTIQRDIEKLIGLELVVKTDEKYFANIGMLTRMFAKRKRSI
ncbi:MAG: Fic family protein [Bacteroidetes bacterium]|nr:Fic family protein [Bacteroidota bacterium]